MTQRDPRDAHGNPDWDAIYAAREAATQRYRDELAELPPCKCGGRPKRFHSHSYQDKGKCALDCDKCGKGTVPDATTSWELRWLRTRAAWRALQAPSTKATLLRELDAVLTDYYGNDLCPAAKALLNVLRVTP